MKCGALNKNHPIPIHEGGKFIRNLYYDCTLNEGHNGKHKARGFCEDWANFKENVGGDV